MQTINGQSFPEWVGSDYKDQMIFRFLSQMGDHYNKNIYWIKGQFGLYRHKMNRIETGFMQRYLFHFLANDMGRNLGDSQDYRFVPSVAMIYDYLAVKPDFHPDWKVKHYGEYCEHCRTNTEGNQGGIRYIYLRYKDEQGQIVRRDYVGACDCSGGKELAAKTKNVDYNELLRSFNALYQDCEISVSHYDFSTRRFVSSRSQSYETWEIRLQQGYFVEDGEGDFIPVWDHSYWRTRYGIALADQLGLEMPSDMRAAIIRERENKKALTRHGKKNRLARAISNDGYTGSVPQAIGSLLS